MSNLPDAVVRAYLAQPGELPAALAHATEAGLDPRWDEAALTLRLPLAGPPALPLDTAAQPITPAMWSEPYLLEGVFCDYRVLPPIWRFLDPRTGQDAGPSAYPSPRGASVIHGNALICAHFSRMAYAEHGGPHGDWNGVESWQTRLEGTEAQTISDMLARLIWEVRYNSQGRMAPLKPIAAAA